MVWPGGHSGFPERADGRCGFSLPSMPPAAIAHATTDTQPVPLRSLDAQCLAISSTLGRAPRRIGPRPHFRKVLRSRTTGTAQMEVLGTSYRGQPEGVKSATQDLGTTPTARSHGSGCRHAAWAAGGQAFACANLLSHHMDLCDGRPMVSRLAAGCLHRCILAEEDKIRSATRILGIGQRAG